MTDMINNELAGLPTFITEMSSPTGMVDKRIAEAVLKAGESTAWRLVTEGRDAPFIDGMHMYLTFAADKPQELREYSFKQTADAIAKKQPTFEDCATERLNGPIRVRVQDKPEYRVLFRFTAR